ncbi:unnamed protein product [Vitrella brassicaformis CCMP3155]|uniref:Uncharacterized protein n=2 Tax=Vitrella brassicaformis TaxID=1169539 RepID=A0A0G4F935_VITBC|nr:unnamed protein product [Vitrella brassicaformis CCMP3155]|eukprot:CEM08865.1 unnamed protein product [Vitrella brassicaformis CCMP3155]
MVPRPRYSSLQRDIRGVRQGAIDEAKRKIFGHLSGKVGEKFFTRPLMAKQLNRWYYPARFLLLNFHVEHYFQMQAQRFAPTAAHPSMAYLSKCLDEVCRKRDAIRELFGQMDEKTFSNNPSLQDLYSLYRTLQSDNPLPFEPDPRLWRDNGFNWYNMSTHTPEDASKALTLLESSYREDPSHSNWAQDLRSLKEAPSPAHLSSLIQDKLGQRHQRATADNGSSDRRLGARLMKAKTGFDVSYTQLTDKPIVDARQRWRMRDDREKEVRMSKAREERREERAALAAAEARKTTTPSAGGKEGRYQLPTTTTGPAAPEGIVTQEDEEQEAVDEAEPEAAMDPEALSQGVQEGEREGGTLGEGEGEEHPPTTPEGPSKSGAEAQWEVMMRLVDDKDLANQQRVIDERRHELESALGRDPRLRAYYKTRHRFFEPLFRRRRIAYLDKLSRGRIKHEKEKKYHRYMEDHPDEAEVWPHNKGSITVPWPSPFN